MTNSDPDELLARIRAIEDRLGMVDDIQRHEVLSLIASVGLLAGALHTLVEHVVREDEDPAEDDSGIVKEEKRVSAEVSNARPRGVTIAERMYQ